ncbi:TonB-dependent receptor [Gilvimarinus agarilyticus]|uniref:TonB-dependent receptor n=1 Tax=Gilvimarinus sp. 2_MG-2023 TaxID=3062666 RepID=UPI001C0A1858|nr:TonB-dependent receptor [Gilvimarinus sp. 2_MG-2023]MBU2887417.1 TonB-dependent receptor [Gilvimarinus agarilyticus]MDO6572076.1 TonB-dependent receptor [Gilvimarinus sp. 2_MG-2023]
MSKYNANFKRKLIASAVASCAMAGFSAPSFAQDDAGQIEEVVVTGIRASLDRAMDVKRESTGVVDAISAEDIGKMPDANLAESLQRVAGVSITRSNGEGARVTVRGIDPSMNLVTLNGRNMPSVTNDGGAGDRASRAFDFASLAAESVSGAEIYKTGRADLSGGGLGATVNLKTLRPLDVGDTKASVGVKAVHDTTIGRDGDGREVTPEVSGVFSWANDDETFGVALSAAYQERDNVRSNAFVNNWQMREVAADGTHGNTPAEASITNPLSPGDLYALPTDLRYALEDGHRERTNGQMTMQFRPVDSFTATVDYTYTEYDLDFERAQQSIWFNESAITALTFDTNQEVYTPVIYNEVYAVGGGKDTSFAQQAYAANSKMESAGLNLEWNVTDNFALALDYHNSSARNYTTQTEIGLNANVTVGEYADFRPDLPVMGSTIDDSPEDKGNGNGYIDGGDISAAMGSARWDSVDSDIEQLRIDGSLDLGGFAFFEQADVTFGIEDRKDTNQALVNTGTSPRITMGNWGGVDPDLFGSDWQSYFSPRDFSEGFPSFSETTDNPNFLSGGVEGDIDKIIDNLEWMYARGLTDPAIGANFADFPNGKVQPNNVINTDRTIVEEVQAAYVQFSGSFNIGDMASNLVVGLRQEETDLISSSVVNTPDQQSWDSDNDFHLIYNPGPLTTVTVENSYDNFLPNVDFDIALTEAIKLRASYSVTIARPSYGNLSSTVSIGGQYDRSASGGNPLLTPLESENLDISAEWYYDDASYLSVALFQKEVSDFIGTGVTSMPVYDLRDPRMGPRFDQAIADIESARSNGDLNRDGTLWNPNSEAHQHDMMLINEGLDPNDETTSIVANSSDPIQQWNVSVPSNFQDDTITGAELSVQHFFGETGFGVQANYTFVESDLDVDNTSQDEQFAMLGVSDTANLALMYDHDRLQARLTYNWRDSYLTSLAQGGNNAPGYVADYSQIDFSISYEVTDNVTLSAEGLNVTGEDSRLYGRSENQMFSLEDLGARYSVGARYTF